MCVTWLVDPSSTKWKDPVGRKLLAILSCIHAGFHNESHSVKQLCHDLMLHEPVLPGPCNPLFAKLQKNVWAGRSPRGVVAHIGVENHRSHAAVPDAVPDAVPEQLLRRADVTLILSSW